MKITDKMVEAAAAALWQENVATTQMEGYHYERLVQVTQEDLRRLARAALEAALREEA